MNKKSISLITVFLALLLNTLSGQKTFENPIIPGMNPDPSICRVGDDFYLINSTFEYFPGLPIYHSKDLVHWKQIGHVLSTSKNNPLMGSTSGTGGQYAPTLRYNEADSTFYVTCTNYTSQGTKGAFYVTAKNITGPWSDPVWVGNWYVDPSPTFVNDTMYYLTPDNAGSFMLGIINTETGKFSTPITKIAEGLGGVSPEGPHLYKINDYYYLMSAEGGTGYEHREVIQRSKSPWGPYEPSPNNPVVSNMNNPEHPFQAIGHADLVQLQDGSWWLVCLGYRPKGGRYHHLGRETFLAPVTWDENGWPKVGTTGEVLEEYPVPNLPEHKWEEEPMRDDFDSSELRLAWNFLRNPDDSNWSLDERHGFLRLKGSGLSFKEKKSPAFICRRQTAFNMVASAKLDFTPAATNEEAGLVVRGDDKNHFDLLVTLIGGKRVAMVRRTAINHVTSVTYKEISDGDVILRVSANDLFYSFWVQEEGLPPVKLDSVATKDLATENIGGFTGTFIGMYASGNGSANTNPADFDWFDMEENPDLPFSWATGTVSSINDLVTPGIDSIVSDIYNEAQISWTDIDDESSYLIERLNNNAFDSVGTVNANETVFVDTGLLGNTLYIYRITAQNASGYSYPSVAKSVITKPKPGSYLGTPHQIPGTIEAENYDYGEAGEAYSDVDKGNKNGAYRKDDVDVEICWDSPQGFDIGWIEGGEWVTYTVDVNESPVDIQLRIATEMGGSMSLMLDGKEVAQATIESTGGWQTWKTVTIPNVVMEKGTNKVLKVDFGTGGYNFNWLKFVKSSATAISAPKNETVLFPNPVENAFYVKNGLNSKYIVQISSVLGEVVKSEEAFDGSFIEVDELMNGIYFVSVITEGSIIKKIVLIKQ